MKGYCNTCGKCCEAITLWISPEEMQKHNYSMHEKETSNDYAWARAHFHPITREEAFKRNPLHAYAAEHVESYNTVHFYECDAYDKENHKCTAHDKRPRVCDGYPHYWGDPQLSAKWIPYSATCDYINDMSPAMKQEWIAVAQELKNQKG